MPVILGRPVAIRADASSKKVVPNVLLFEAFLCLPSIIRNRARDIVFFPVYVPSGWHLKVARP